MSALGWSGGRPRRGPARRLTDGFDHQLGLVELHIGVAAVRCQDLLCVGREREQTGLRSDGCGLVLRCRDDADRARAERLAMLPQIELVAGQLLQLGVGRIGQVRTGVNGAGERCIQSIGPAGVGKAAEEALVATELGRRGRMRVERVPALLNLGRLLDEDIMTPGDHLGGSGVARIGVGGVGNFVVQNLAMAGVRHFVLVDPDRVELSNLSRQILFRESDVGRSKVNAAADWIRGFDSEAVVDTRSRSVRNKRRCSTNSANRSSSSTRSIVVMW